jgi:hypothetical protein
MQESPVEWAHLSEPFDVASQVDRGGELVGKCPRQLSKRRIHKLTTYSVADYLLDTLAHRNLG